MKKFACVTIGNEILQGFRIDTDFLHLTKKLKEKGFYCVFHITVSDSIEDIKKGLKYASSESDIIFTIGGLGPTPDDLTREAIAEFFDLNLEFREDLFKEIKEKEPMRDREKHKKYGLFPKGAKVFENKKGLAFAFCVQKDKKCIYSLPGPKDEFESTLEEIMKDFKPFEDFFILYFDLPMKKEIEIQERLKGKIKEENIFFLPYTAGVILGIKGKSSDKEKLKEVIINEFKEEISSEGPETLEKVVGELLRRNKKTLSIAESCTGGLLASRITDVPGSSDYFIGGVVAYSNEIKKRILKVKEEDLIKYGAVSESVVKQMAEGIKNLYQTDFGLAISGIAGPTGGTPQKPVGTVFLAVSYSDTTRVFKEFFKGSRKDIKFKSSHFLLNELRKILLKV